MNKYTKMVTVAASGALLTLGMSSGSAMATDVNTGFRLSSVSHESTMTTAGGWLGKCHTKGGSNWGGGWCNGNGPSCKYYGIVFDKAGREWDGPTRWAGDRRGSYGHTPSGVKANGWGTNSWCD
jgi:hypothetical protein